MRWFRKLMLLGVLAVTFILVIDTIDAGRKQVKKKQLATEKSFDQENFKSKSKNKYTENMRHDKLKKSGSRRSENYEEENLYVNKDSVFESKKPEVKKNIKMASKENKYTENEKTKTSKHYQKSKKTEFNEGPVDKFDSYKAKIKKSKPKYLRSENVDKIVKTSKKTTQKKLIEEKENVEKMLSEELNRLKHEESISVEETTGGNSKKRKYKMVEVELEEGGQEGNELTERESEVHEILDIEEITENPGAVQNPKLYKNKKSAKKLDTLEEELNDESTSEDNYFNNTEGPSELEVEEMSSEFDSLSRFADPEVETCTRLPDDPNRKGPKKLTLYVMEEEVNGEVRRSVVSEEDGVTMCEVAELLKESYNLDIPDY